MAGHSKWAQIKRKKAANDQKRGQLFSKLLKEIEIAVRLGGANPDANVRLKNAILRAKQEGVPNDNINRAIQRGAGEKDKGALEELLYEGFGPANAAFIARVVTDNKNRTASEIRHLVVKFGGTLGGTNSVRHLFKERGVIRIKGNNLNEDDILSSVIQFDIDDIETLENEARIVLEIKDLSSCAEVLKDKFEVLSAGIEFIPVLKHTVSEEELEKVISFFEALDDHNDVQEIFFNVDI